MIANLATSWVRVCTRPYTAVFAGELQGKSNLKTFCGVTVAAVVGFLLSWGLYLLSGRPAGGFMGLAGMWVKSGTAPPFWNWEILVPCGVILGFYDFEIVLFIVARLLGGKGTFGSQAYAQSLFYAPLAVVQQVVAVTPVFARLLFAVAAVWSLMPTTTSLRAAHGYSLTRAVLTWAAPIVLNVVVVAVIILVASAGRRSTL